MRIKNLILFSLIDQFIKVGVSKEIPLHLKINKVINNHDPLSLLDVGAPEDEYQFEANELAK